MTQATAQNIKIGTNLRLARNPTCAWPIGREIVVTGVGSYITYVNIDGGDAGHTLSMSHVGDFDIFVPATFDLLKLGMILENARNPLYVWYKGRQMEVIGINEKMRTFDIMCLDDDDILRDIRADESFIKDLDIVDISAGGYNKLTKLQKLFKEQERIMWELAEVNALIALNCE